jgi:hypothetical protein
MIKKTANIILVYKYIRIQDYKKTSMLTSLLGKLNMRVLRNAGLRPISWQRVFLQKKVILSICGGDL